MKPKKKKRKIQIDKFISDILFPKLDDVLDFEFRLMDHYGCDFDIYEVTANRLQSMMEENLIWVLTRELDSNPLDKRSKV